VTSLPRTRPAETTTGVAAALAVLLCAIFDVDDPTIYGALVIVVGFLPTAVTTLVVYVQAQRGPQGTTYVKPEPGVPESSLAGKPPTKRRKRG
jgi:hypothetical protein